MADDGAPRADPDQDPDQDQIHSSLVQVPTHLMRALDEVAQPCTLVTELPNANVTPLPDLYVQSYVLPIEMRWPKEFEFDLPLPTGPYHAVPRVANPPTTTSDDDVERDWQQRMAVEIENYGHVPEYLYMPNPNMAIMAALVGGHHYQAPHDDEVVAHVNPHFMLVDLDYLQVRLQPNQPRRWGRGTGCGGGGGGGGGGRRRTPVWL